jgi:hypothetical protein
MENQLNVEELAKINNQTNEELKELRPIVHNLYGKSVLGLKMLKDENYTQITELDWGSVEYVRKLKKLIEHYQFGKTFFYEKFNTQEAIDKYKHYNCGVMLREGEKSKILFHTYCIYMVNSLSEELRYIIISSN